MSEEGARMRTLDKQIERLIRTERLDNFERLLTPREWDEVPFVSRLARIEFLSYLDVQERSRVLVASAVKLLDRILDFAEAAGRAEVVVLVSAMNWDDLYAVNPDPIIPKFWICTNVQRDLTNFRLVPGTSKEALLVAYWLRSSDLLQSHEVFEEAELEVDPELRRVYVGRRGCVSVDRLAQR
jgi:hypothetical protein